MRFFQSVCKINVYFKFSETSLRLIIIIIYFFVKGKVLITELLLTPWTMWRNFSKQSHNRGGGTGILFRDSKSHLWMGRKTSPLSFRSGLLECTIAL